MRCARNRRGGPQPTALLTRYGISEDYALTNRDDTLLGGHIGVASMPGIGSTFRVWLRRFLLSF